MMSHGPDIWTVLLNRSGDFRHRVVFYFGLVTGVLFFTTLYIYYLRGIPDSGLDHVWHHPAVSAFVFAAAFLWPTQLLAEWLGGKMIIHERRPNNLDKPWKQRVKHLFLLRLGALSTLLALAFGVLMALIFDYYLARTLYDSFIGRTARVLADIWILLISMAVFAAIFLQRR